MEKNKVEAELVKKAQGGDKKAFEQLCMSVIDSVHGYLYGKLKRDHDAIQDLVSEVFLRVTDKLSTFGMESSFKTWVFGIAKNVFLEYLRVKKQKAKTELTIAWEEVDQRTLEQMKHQYQEIVEREKAIRAEEFIILKKAIDTLSDEQQEVIFLRFTEALSIKHVAAILDKSEASIKNLQYRAFLKIKEFFAGNMKEKRG